MEQFESKKSSSKSTNQSLKLQENFSTILRLGIFACIIAIILYVVFPTIAVLIVPKDAIMFVALLLLILILVAFAIRIETKRMKKDADAEKERYHLSVEDPKFEEWFRKFRRVHFTQITLNSMCQLCVLLFNALVLPVIFMSCVIILQKGTFLSPLTFIFLVVLSVGLLIYSMIFLIRIAPYSSNLTPEGTIKKDIFSTLSQSSTITDLAMKEVTKLIDSNVEYEAKTSAQYKEHILEEYQNNFDDKFTVFYHGAKMNQREAWEAQVIYLLYTNPKQFSGMNVNNRILGVRANVFSRNLCESSLQKCIFFSC